MLNPLIGKFLEELASEGGKPTQECTPSEVRAGAIKKWAPKYLGTSEPLGSIEYKYFTGPTADLPIAIYTPEGVGPFPAIVFFHGGGWVAGNIALNSVQHQLLAKETGAVVISVNYQKAPEHKFPIPHDDCYATLEWVTENASNLNVNPNQVGVAGDSAGGNLAIGVALRARDNHGPKIAFQLLMYPVTDHNFNYPSMVDNATGYALTTDAMRWYWEQYVATPADFENPYACPMSGEDFSSMPPAVIITAELDPLRDEAEKYAERLKVADVPVYLKRYDGMVHGFLLMQGFLPEARSTIKDLARELANVLIEG